MPSNTVVVALYSGWMKGVEVDEAAEPLGLDAVVAGGPDQLLERFFAEGIQGVRFEQLGLAEVPDGPLHVPPVPSFDSRFSNTRSRMAASFTSTKR